MNSDFSDNDLLGKLLSEGVAKLTGDELTHIADLLEGRAVDTGLAAPLFVSQSVRAVLAFMMEHDEAGGVRIEFLRDLDVLYRTLLPAIQHDNPLDATRIAQQLRDEIKRSISHYKSSDTYE